MRRISSTSKISTMSSQTSRPSTGFACSFQGNYEGVQHHCQPYTSHQNLCDKATSAVLFNSSIRNWFRTTVGVRQGCLLSPTLFNISLERIITDALEDHKGTVSSGGRRSTNLRFADDVDGLGGEEEEMAKLLSVSTKAPQPTALRSVPRRPS